MLTSPGHQDAHSSTRGAFGTVLIVLLLHLQGFLTVLCYRLHCEAVARELRARGRAGEGYAHNWDESDESILIAYTNYRATVKVEEFVHLFLTQGQLDYLYAAEPRNRPHITLDTLSLPSDYMRATLEDPLNMSPCQFFGRPANNAPASIHELVNYKDRSGRWVVLWPELRRAMDRYIPQDVWPCGVPYSAYGMVHPYA